jgi:hypothetical protein
VGQLGAVGLHPEAGDIDFDGICREELPVVGPESIEDADGLVDGSACIVVAALVDGEDGEE